MQAKVAESMIGTASHTLDRVWRKPAMFGLMSRLTILRATLGLRSTLKHAFNTVTSSSTLLPSPFHSLPQRRPVFATAEFRPGTRRRQSSRPATSLSGSHHALTRDQEQSSAHRPTTAVTEIIVPRRTVALPKWAFIPGQSKRDSENGSEQQPSKQPQARPATTIPTATLLFNPKHQHVHGDSSGQSRLLRPATTAPSVSFCAFERYAPQGLARAHSERDSLRGDVGSPMGDAGAVRQYSAAGGLLARPMTAAEAVAAGVDPVLMAWRRPENLDVPGMTRGRSDGVLQQSGVERTRAKSRKLLGKLMMN